MIYGCRGEDGGSARIENYFTAQGEGDLWSPDGARLTAEVIEALAGPEAPGLYAQAGQLAQAGGTAIGQVSSASGGVKATRSDGTTVDLDVGDPVFQGDVVRTSSTGELGITFVDDTIFSLSANARMVLDELIFNPAGSDNALGLSLVQGTFVFVTGKIAPAGGIEVNTPVGTIGIRGTTVGVKVEAVNGATKIANLAHPVTNEVGQFEFTNEAGTVFFQQLYAVLDVLSATSLDEPMIGVPEELLRIFGRGLSIIRSSLGLREDDEQEGEFQPGTGPGGDRGSDQQGRSDLDSDSIQLLFGQDGTSLFQGSQAAADQPPLVTGAGPQGVIGGVGEAPAGQGVVFSQGSGVSGALRLGLESAGRGPIGSRSGGTIETTSPTPSPSSGSTDVPRLPLIITESDTTTLIPPDDPPPPCRHSACRTAAGRNSSPGPVRSAATGSRRKIGTWDGRPCPKTT